jgi:hypothetical protein
MEKEEFVVHGEFGFGLGEEGEEPLGDAPVCARHFHLVEIHSVQRIKICLILK